MKTQHLFCREDCIAIEDKYGKHIVYRAFRSPCLTIINESKTFSLHPSELFYHCFYTIDLMKEMSLAEKKGYCHYQLREDLNAYFMEKVENVDEEDIRMAVCLVMQAVAEWFVRLGSECFPLVMLLKEQMNENVTFKLNDAFRHGFRCVEGEEFTQFISVYMESDVWISEEIHALLDDMDDESGCELQSSLQIAEGKKRPVVVALKAIIESWIEDTNGGRPKNIENAINEVLRLAFGVKKYTPVNQTIKPSNDNNFEGSMNRIAEEIAQKIKSFASEKNKKR